MIRVAILGSGPVGQALAAFIGVQPHCDVRLWGRSLGRPGRLSIDAVGTGTVGTDKVVHARGLAIATATAHEAVRDAEVVVLAMPTHVHASVLTPLASALDRCALLLAWEGTGRVPETLRALGLRGPAIAGLQRSPVLCRLRRHRREVEILGVRSRVVAAALDRGDTAAVRRLFAALLPFRFDFAPDYACATLSPGNPLIHPARIFRCVPSRLRGGRGRRLYADWDDAASETLLALHGELARLRDARGLPRRYLRTLRDGSSPMTADALTRATREARTLARVRLPLLETPEGPVWDVTHRFFREDIGEGLETILAIATETGVSMPVATSIRDWYHALVAASSGGTHAAHRGLR